MKDCTMQTTSKIHFLALFLFFLSTSQLEGSEQTEITLKSYESKITSCVENALCINLPPTDNIVSYDAFEYMRQAFAKVEEGDYATSLEIIFEAVKKLPTNFSLQVNLATLLGDYAECERDFDEILKERMIKKSQEIFQKLLAEVEGQSKRPFYYFQNEYCFRFAKYKEQYEFGVTRVADYWGTEEWNTRGFWGYYCQGVGAANYARDLLKQGNQRLALEYVQKAIVAWAQYFSYRNDYYNSYVHYALALGILGYKDEMMKALQHSADLIKKDLDYVEFRDVIEFVSGLENSH